MLKVQQQESLPILLASALSTPTEMVAYAQVALQVLGHLLDPLPQLIACARLTSMELEMVLFVLPVLTRVPLQNKLQSQTLPLSLLVAHAQTIPMGPIPMSDALPAPMQVPLLEL
jgi:hypothetical protein